MFCRRPPGTAVAEARTSLAGREPPDRSAAFAGARPGRWRSRGAPVGGSRRDGAARGRRAAGHEGEVMRRADRPGAGGDRAGRGLPQLDARELVDEEYLERAIKEMYTEVAENPGGEFHFLTGRAAGRGPRLRPGRCSTGSRPRRSSRSRGSGHYFDLGGLGRGRVRRRPGQRIRDGPVLRGGAGGSGRPGDRDRHDGGPARRRRGRLRDAHGFSQVELVEAQDRGGAAGGRDRRLRRLERGDQPRARQGAGARRGGAGS